MAVETNPQQLIRHRDWDLCLSHLSGSEVECNLELLQRVMLGGWEVAVGGKNLLGMIETFWVGKLSIVSTEKVFGCVDPKTTSFNKLLVSYSSDNNFQAISHTHMSLAQPAI